MSRSRGQELPEVIEQVAMEVVINLLHLTDLHIGAEGQEWSWSRLKHEFSDDLGRVKEHLAGPWDLVLFTGDLTQSGTKEQFALLEKELCELWPRLSGAQDQPRLCVVPGNHDLARLPHNTPVEAALRTGWADESLRGLFWADANNAYRVAVASCFDNYVSWLHDTKLPILGIPSGWIPGDFGGTLTKGSVDLGIVGLNSAFLQLSSGNYEGTLELHASQLAKACGSDQVAWLRRHSANLLLTHHPPTWLSASALEHFREEIYSPGDFLLHLCGHQHEPVALDTSEAGAGPRRVRQAASLFGLEHWAGTAEPRQRIHGYTAYQLTFRDNEVLERYWPRVAVKGRHGGMHIGPDSSFKLGADGSAAATHLLPLYAQRNSTSRVSLPKPSVGSEEQAANPSLEVFEDVATAQAALAACPRLTLSAPPSYRATRLEARRQFTSKLEDTRCVWLTADWGMGSREFVSCAIQELSGGTGNGPVFLLSCDEIADIDRFEVVAQQQLTVTIQQFCRAASTLGGILVLENVHPDLCAGRSLERLLLVVRAILDYAEDLRVVVVSRLKPQSDTVAPVEIGGMDVPELRAFVSSHQDASPELLEPHTLERLHACTDGLPIHVDRALKSLRVASLDTVLNPANQLVPQDASTIPSTTALAHAIESLVISEDGQSRRSLRLLKVLSVLPQGEPLEAVKHYLPTEPFFERNALQLNELGLLEVQWMQAFPGAGVSSNYGKTAPKILKVPRQVRDYVLSTMAAPEREALTSAGLDRFFGPAWREGKIKARSQRPQTQAVSDVLGNEFALLQYVLSRNSTVDSVAASRHCMLALQYCRNLNNQDRYRDVAIAAVPLLQSIERETQPAAWAELASLAGKGLRMTGQYDEAVGWLRSALDLGDSSLSKDDTTNIWLNIALLEESRQNKDEAVAAAKEVEKLTSKDSGTGFQARAILASLTLAGRDRARRLVKLERDARSKGFRTVADNIALGLAREARDTKAQVRYCDRVLKSREFSYNQVRAIVNKVSYVHASGVAQVSPPDFALLVRSYSYLYTQRFASLLDQCHEALWRELDARGKLGQLLLLFRHTSFLWRIRGQEDKETEYLNRLRSKPIDEPAPATAAMRLASELQYFWSRVRAVIGAVSA
jgi:hypothetical protein